MKNTFYFNVPYSLPNMYALLSERLYYFGNTFLDILTQTSNPNGGIVSAGVEIAKQNKYNRQVLAKKQEILNQAFLNNKDMRTCFLDMDSGDIIYY
jgi:hypothetical protein